MSHNPQPERGSVSVWLVNASVVMMLLVGVVVDLTGQVHAQQHTRSIAAQAARAAGQEINAAAVINGQGVRADAAQAIAAARAYLNAAGVSGTATLVGGTTVEVSASSNYTTKFLSLIGLHSMPVTGTASAQLIRAVEGAPR